MSPVNNQLLKVQLTMKRLTAFASLVLFSLAQTTSAEIHRFHYENILGTSLELHIESDDSDAADRLKESALDEITRLSKILSSYDPTSEVSRWQRGELPGKALSNELSSVLTRAEYWRQQTGGAFDVRTKHLHNFWCQAEQRGVYPTTAQRQKLINSFSKAPYKWTSGTITMIDPNVAISLDALAKGFILDRVCQKILELDGETENFLINIGGDIRKLGSARWDVGIENPFTPHENADPLTRVKLTTAAAIATSGNYRRGYVINNVRESHIFDPRIGLPTSHIRSASVLATTGMDADALATAFSVLSVQQSLELAESHKEVECLLVLNNGSIVKSTGWPGRNVKESTESYVQAFQPQKNTGLHLTFSLNRPQEGRYRRPYVAIWLEDKDGFPVKTALLWLQIEQPGPRWHRDLTRWYRNDRARKLVESTDMIKTVGGATRGPGKYETRFDGTDNSGKQLPSGRYTLCIEVAREHGTYQIIRKPVELGSKAIPLTKIAGNVEVGGISYQYTPPTSRAN